MLHLFFIQRFFATTTQYNCITVSCMCVRNQLLLRYMDYYTILRKDYVCQDSTSMEYVSYLSILLFVGKFLHNHAQTHDKDRYFAEIQIVIFMPIESDHRV